MPRRYDHIDLRVRNLREITPFYESLLPALGFRQEASIEGWLTYESGDGPISEFFGVTESPGHVPNENRIAFWAETDAEVDRIAEVARNAGALKIEGPMVYDPGYYAIFFEDPSGNRLEVCHRVPA